MSDSRGPVSALMAGLHRPVYESRLRALVRAVAPALPRDARVLDVGCGSGMLGSALMSERPDVRVEGLERFPRGGEAIHVTGYAGGRMPFDDGAFDAVIIADVLHHETEPLGLLGECARVSRGVVIVKDHVLQGAIAQQRLSFSDWAANAPYGVKCLYRYNTPERWRDWFRSLGLGVVEERLSMDLYPPLLNMLFGRRLQYFAVVRRANGEAAP